MVQCGQRESMRLAQEEVDDGADAAGHEDDDQHPEAGGHVAALDVAADVADQQDVAGEERCPRSSPSAGAWAASRACGAAGRRGRGTGRRRRRRSRARRTRPGIIAEVVARRRCVVPAVLASGFPARRSHHMGLPARRSGGSGTRPRRGGRRRREGTRAGRRASAGWRPGMSVGRSDRSVEGGPDGGGR